MKNLIDHCKRRFEHMTKKTAAALHGVDLDWNRIEEARERLVRMRFREPSQSELSRPSDPSNVYKVNTELGATGILATLRERDRQTMSRWFAKDRQDPDLTKKLHEAVYRNSSLTADNDWHIGVHHYSSYVLSQIEVEHQQEQPHSNPVIRGYLGMTQLP